MKSIVPVLLLAAAALFAACNDDDVPVNADAGDSQTVMANETVTLDGSRSTGPSSRTYEWLYEGPVPEQEIQFQNKTSVNPTFVPPRGGVYLFTLIVSAGGQASMDEVAIIVSGGVEIGGTLTEDLVLENIEPNGSIPDYFISSDLIVPEGITVSVGEENVQVFFDNGVGMEIQAGGTLTNTNLEPEGIDVIFRGNPGDGWKGILVNNGTVAVEEMTIEYGGSAKFDGVEEAGAVIFTGGAPSIEIFRNNDFKGSFSYDVLVESDVVGQFTFGPNKYSFKYPVKSPLQFMQVQHPDFRSTYSDDFEYHIITTGGAQNRNTGDYTISAVTKYLFDDNLWVEGRINVGGGVTLYFQTDCGMYCEGSGFIKWIL